METAEQRPFAADVDILYDVVQIGYGPVGQANAAILGKRGHRVAVFEKQPSLFGLSRAGHIDHEIMRILQSIDVSAEMERESVCPDMYEWLTADRQSMMQFPWLDGISGFRTAYLFYQPVLETALDGRVRRLPNVDVSQGWEAVGIEQHPDHVAVTVQPKGDDGSEQQVVRGRYLVASDGGSSFVRQQLGVEMKDLGYRHGWLVLDLRNKRHVDFGFQNGQICDPARPTSLFEMGKYHCRFSFAAMPGETEEFLLRPETAWDLVKSWATPDDCELIRQVYYTLEAKVVEQMRPSPRIFLIGDSAHVMPPFLGQGMCSGLRDAFNLSWKLDLVLRGEAHDALLDTYTPERQPHSERYAELSMELAKLLCMTDPEKARQRDEAFLAGNPPPLKPMPWIESGVLQTDPPPALSELIGRLAPQGVIELDGARDRADDVVGSGWHIFSRSDVLGQCDAESQLLLGKLGFRILEFTSAGAKDVEGVYVDFLQTNGLDAVLVRPDFYVFGGVESGGDMNVLLRDLRRQLQLTA
jgi:2-polyprenyl-6-methoxyphenol hydroxylase-like FAD-dependent oxidoreductase